MLGNLLTLTENDKDELLNMLDELIHAHEGDEDCCDAICYLLDCYSGYGEGNGFYICMQLVRDKIIIYLTDEADIAGYPTGNIYATEFLQVDWVKQRME